MSETWLRRLGRSLVGRPPAGTKPAAERAPATCATWPGAPSGLPSHGEIVERLRFLVVQQSDGTRSPEDVAAGDHLYDRGHVDSVGGVTLLTFIKDHYGVTIDEADLVRRLHSLDALAGHILASVPLAQP